LKTVFAAVFNGELQLSPVMSTGNTMGHHGYGKSHHQAAIEPGHVDREHPLVRPCVTIAAAMLQLSPVMSTGNTQQ